MMNYLLACSSGGWPMIVSAAIFYSALGLAIFWLIRKLRSGNSSPPPTDGGSFFRSRGGALPETVTSTNRQN